MNRWRELASMNIRPAVEYCGRSRRWVGECIGAAIILGVMLAWIVVLFAL